MKKPKKCIIGDGYCPCLPVAAKGGPKPARCLWADKFKCPSGQRKRKKNRCMKRGVQ